MSAEKAEIVAEITRLIGEYSKHPKTHIEGRVRVRLDELTRLIPRMRECCSRENKAHAEKLLRTIDALMDLLATAPPGFDVHLVGLEDTDRKNLNVQLGRLRMYCGLVFSYHGHYDVAAHRCAEYGADLIEELAPGARISSASPNSLFRQVAGLLYVAVQEKSLEDALNIDLERACDFVIREAHEHEAWLSEAGPEARAWWRRMCEE
jgi:hypothetical protein